MKSEPTRDHEVRIPGVSNPVVVRTHGVLKSELLVNGEPAEKGSWGKRFIPADDGRQLSARLKLSITGFVLAVEKTKYNVGAHIPVSLGIVSLLPAGLFATGGAIGGGIGGLAIVLNRRIAHGARSTPLKLGLMLGVTGLAFAVLLVLQEALARAFGRP